MKDLTALLESDEPSVRLKTALRVLGKDPESGEMQKLAQEVKGSERVRLLLSERTENGSIPGRRFQPGATSQ